MKWIDKKYVLDFLKFALNQAFDRRYKELNAWKYLLANNENVTFRVLYKLFLDLIRFKDDNPLYVDRSRELSYIYEWSLMLNQNWITRKIPANLKVMPHDFTTKQLYMIERNKYRFFQNEIRQYSTLPKWAYDEYVVIAEKYNWDFIKADEESEY